VSHFLSSPQNAACIESLKTMLRILQESDPNQHNHDGRRVLVWIFLSMFQNPWTITNRSYSEGGISLRWWQNDNYCIFHCIDFSRSRRSVTAPQIELVLFCTLLSSGFEKGKPEFSSWDARAGFLGAHGQFSVPQWIKSGLKNRETSPFAIIPPALFTRHKLGWLLALWHVEKEWNYSKCISVNISVHIIPFHVNKLLQPLVSFMGNVLHCIRRPDDIIQHQMKGIECWTVTNSLHITKDRRTRVIKCCPNSVSFI
jgi:hypothetical protein